MPPPFTNGPLAVASSVGWPTGQSVVVLPPDAVIPDTAEWCYLAQAAKWRPGCPGTVPMYLAWPVIDRLVQCWWRWPAPSSSVGGWSVEPGPTTAGRPSPPPIAPTGAGS